MTTYYWKVRVRDNHNVSTDGPVWSFTTGNEAFSIPTYLMPGQGSSVAYDNAYLSWLANDSDIGDTLTYDIYFGTTSAPPLVRSDSAAATFELGALTPGTTYCWKITAKDSYGSITEGPVGIFQTFDHDPVTLNTQITTDTILAAADGPYIVNSGFSEAAAATPNHNFQEYLAGTDPQNDQDVPDVSADLNHHGDMDGSDLAVLAAQMGRVDCSVSAPCAGDLDLDGDVDDVDLQMFVIDFGHLAP